ADLEPLGGAIAHDGDRDALTGGDVGDAPLQLGDLADLAAVELDDHVAGAQAGHLGGPALHHVGDEDALALAHAEARGQLVGDVLDGDAEPAAHHAALGDQLAHDHLRLVDRDREADALAG